MTSRIRSLFGVGESPMITILSCAIGSRVILTVLFLLWRSLVNSYDTSSDLNLPCLSNSSWSAAAPSSLSSTPQIRPAWTQSLGRALERTIVWDGVHYVRIAECGYEYEQVHAFFPALPLLIRALSQTVFYPLIPLLGARPTLALSGYVISNCAFVFAAYFLYQLSLKVLKEDTQAVWAVALFCFNPASTFYSAIYSESLFALFSFAGLFYYLNGPGWVAILLFSFSSATRSNGILHAGFILFQAMHKAFALGYNAKRLKDLEKVISIVLVALFQSIVVFAPFVAFQYYGYKQLCLKEDRSRRRPWCDSTIPYIYGFVQSYYWNVGFLRYFQLKQLPNFLLATPTLVLSVCAVVTFVNRHSDLFFSLGLAAPRFGRTERSYMSDWTNDCELRVPNLESMTTKGTVTKQVTDSHQHTGTLKRRKSTVKAQGGVSDDQDENCVEKGFDSPEVLCFLYQLIFMVVTATLVMHVQVATRFLSVCPPVYWYGSSLMNHRGEDKRAHLIWIAFLSYIGIGSLLFINFYPFT